jgi:tetratricopeptide (TPR) repeat protein
VLDRELETPSARTTGAIMGSSNPFPWPQFKIIEYMIFAAVAAVALAIFREEPEVPLTIWFFLGFAFFHALITTTNPLRKVLARLPADVDQRIASLEDGLARSNPLDRSATLKARYLLLELYAARHRYEEAIGEGRRILKMRGVPLAIASDTHLRISNCLDSLGRGAESPAERLAAETYLEQQPWDVNGWFIRGKLLDNQRRYGEAVEAYVHALRWNPRANTQGRDNMLLKLILALFHAGRSEETLKWAEQAIEVGVSSPRLYDAHRMAGTAAASLGRLDEAERHHRRAHELAVQAADTKKVVDCLATLGDHHFRLGDLDKAEALCQEAESLRHEASRHALLNHAHILRSRGRFQEAVEKIEQASKVGVVSIASLERHSQATLRLWKANNETDLGWLDEASADLQEATAELDSHPQLGPICEGEWVRLLALRGDREESVRRAAALLRMLNSSTLRQSTKRTCLGLLGRGLLEAGEFELAQFCWERYLSGAWYPVMAPTGHYYLGECRWHLSDPDGALAEFRRARASGIDSHHARLAEQRLRTLSPDQASGT